MKKSKRLARQSSTNQNKGKEGPYHKSCYVESSDEDKAIESDVSIVKESDLLSDHLSDLNLDDEDYELFNLKEKIKDANIRTFNEYFRCPGSSKSENGEFQVMYTVVFNPSKCYQFLHNTSRVRFYAESNPFEYAVAVPSPKIPCTEGSSPSSRKAMTCTIASCAVYDNLHVRPHIVMSEKSVTNKLATKFPKMKLNILPPGENHLPLTSDQNNSTSCPASYLCTPNPKIPEWQKKVKIELCQLINDSHVQSVMTKNSGTSSTRSKAFFFNNGYEASNCTKYKKDVCTGALEPSLFNVHEMGDEAKKSFCCLQRPTLGEILPAMGYKNVYHKNLAGKCSPSLYFKIQSHINISIKFTGLLLLLQANID